MLNILRKINLHIVNPSEDYLIHTPAFLPKALSSMIFASDVPHSWTERSKDIESIYNHSLIQHLISMPHLEILTVRNAEWLSTNNVQHILGFSLELKRVDFAIQEATRTIRTSSRGGNWGRRDISIRWTIMGTVKEVAEILVAQLSLELEEVMDDN